MSYCCPPVQEHFVLNVYVSFQHWIKLQLNNYFNLHSFNLIALYDFKTF